MFMVAGLVDSAGHTTVGPTMDEWVRYRTKQRKGRKNDAEQSALLLDEIDSMSEGEGCDEELTAYQQAFGSQSPREAVLEVSCRAAVLMGKLCGDNVPEDYVMTDDEAVALAREAYEFVTKYMVGLFGPMHTTKMHRLAYHLQDELRQRGNLVEADTSVNEMLHKLCNIMYVRSNKSADHFVLQLLRAEQTLAFITAEDDSLEMLRAADLVGPADELMDATAEGQLNADQAVMDGMVGRASTGAGASRLDDAVRQTFNDLRPEVGGGLRSREGGRTSAWAMSLSCRPDPSRARGLRVSVGEVQAEHGGELSGLGKLLGLESSQLLHIANSLKFRAHFSWRAAGRDQQVRAAGALYRSPWWDHILYTAEDDGQQRWGRAILIIKGIDAKRRTLVIIQRLCRAETRPECVLTKFNCTRLKWHMDDETHFPLLDAVRLENVVRLEHIVPDFQDLCDRLGLFAFPGTTPRTKEERCAERWWVNVFYPWTSNGLATDQTK